MESTTAAMLRAASASTSAVDKSQMAHDTAVNHPAAADERHLSSAGLAIVALLVAAAVMAVVLLRRKRRAKLRLDDEPWRAPLMPWRYSGGLREVQDWPAARHVADLSHDEEVERILDGVPC